MNIVACLLLTSSILGCVAASGTNHEDFRKNSAGDFFLHSINSEIWEEDEKSCIEATKDMLNSVLNKTLWATWIWDSMQYPKGVFYGSRIQMGNYDQCINPPWLKSHPHLATQYCIIEVQITGNPRKMLKDYDPYDNVSSYLQTASKYGRHFNKMLLSLCVSKKCQHKTVEKLSRHWLQGTHFSHPNSRDYKLKLCTDNRTSEYTFGVKAFFGVTTTLVLVTLTATVYQAINKKNTSTAVSKIAECFDIQHNWNSLFSIHSEDIIVLNGIRTIVGFIVVVVHINLGAIIIDTANGLDADETIFHPSSGYIFFHIDLVVETFFVVSSLLLTKNLLSMKRNNIFLNPIKRYIRLIGIFAITIFYMTAVSTYFTSGPYKNLFGVREQKLCEKTWWKQLLMMNVDVTEMCCFHTWFIPCDYQLSLLATALVLIFIWNRKIGYLTFGIVLLLALFIPGFITYWHSLALLPFAGIEDIINYHDIEELNIKYVKTYTRAGAYIIGMAMGYVIFQYSPTKYRNTISKKWSVIGIIVAVALMLASLATGKIMMDRPYNPIEASIISAIDRPVWAIATCIIIAVCEYGNSSYIRNILSWRVFIPLSRLSYGIYISHVPIVYRNRQMSRSQVTFDPFSMIIDVLGIYSLSIIVSTVLWMLVEAPVNNISAKFLFRRNTRQGEIENKSK